MLRVIGDIHGQIRSYMKLIRDVEYSVQLGDFGFKATYDQLDWYLDQRDYNRNNHVFVPGNHDDYNHLPESALGSFGYRVVDQIGYFWIRGAFSIDHAYRNINIDWWPQEELTYSEMQLAIDIYSTTMPSMVLTHDCPESILPYLVGGDLQTSRTCQGLQSCLNIHRPRLWIFGHHHVTKAFFDGYTVFFCLGELDYLDINTMTSMGYDEGISAIRNRCEIVRLDKF